MPVTVEGLIANEDGLYRLSDLDNRMAEAMSEYENIEDAPTNWFFKVSQKVTNRIVKSNFLQTKK